MATWTPDSPVADLSLAKSINDTTPDVGDVITFTVTISNAGPSVATGVTVSERLPGGYTYVSSNASAGTSYSNTTGLWTVGSLAVNGEASLVITATVNATGVYTNYVQVATSNQLDPDSDPGNGPQTPAEDDEDSVTPTPNPVADLSVHKVSAPNPFTAGGPITYTIVVENAGPSALTAITLTDNVPAAVQSPVFSESEGSYDEASGAWTGLTLGAGESITLTIVGTVEVGTTQLVNTAIVTPTGATDPNPGNNEDIDTNPTLFGVVDGVVYIDVNGIDVNGDGQYDAGTDTPIANVTVTITDTLGTVYTIETDANGYYSQTVPAGSTTVLVDESDADFPATGGLTPNDPNGTGDNENPGSVTVPANGTGTENAGYLPPAGLVTGVVYEDTNGNGQQDAGEPGIPGVSIVITDSLGVTTTVTTDASGNYTATVPAGSTTANVDETTLPPGYVQTAGSDPTTVFVAAGSTTNAGNDGYQPPVPPTAMPDEDLNNLPGTPVTVTVVFNDTPGSTPLDPSTVSLDPTSVPGGIGFDFNNRVRASIRAAVVIQTPTLVDLLSFTATPQPDNSLRIDWVTGSEINTWGFHLWRSASRLQQSDGNRNDAERITGELVVASGGPNLGARYSVVDRTVQPGIRYTYWLQEIELDGTRNEYGPIQGGVGLNGGDLPTNSSLRIFLPMVGSDVGARLEAPAVPEDNVESSHQLYLPTLNRGNAVRSSPE